jgi:DNA-binding transcriptional MerR regulator
MDGPDGYGVGPVARMSGVTVRALHHYDAVGLLHPTGRTEAGYRRYSDDDLERLQRILFYRELGFGLDRIRALMAADGADALVHLRAQHRLLIERIGRLERMADAVAHAMEAHQMGIPLTPEERFEVFGDFDPDQYEDEARERWGSTDAYAQSARRTASYRKEDWSRMKAEADAINDRFVAAMTSGLPPTSEEAMDAAEAHRAHISAWFYDCPMEMHVGLAEMYIADPRFEANYEKLAQGLARYVHDAILASADRAAAAG